MLGTLVRRVVDLGRIEIGVRESWGVCGGGVANGEEVGDSKRFVSLYWW